MPAPEIRILAVDKNKRGDLFARLTSDLFFSLGYDANRLNIHKSGREIDIEGEHRFEPRRLLAECKATGAKMGGADLNKFLGVLTRERLKCSPRTIAGYFVSLSGFTETAVEQENESKPDCIILIDSARIRQELEQGRVLVTAATAMERAGRCAEAAELTGAAVDSVELLGHDRGYIWAIYYAIARQRTHFALIHADGTPLSVLIADEIVSADAACGGTLKSLCYLPPRDYQAASAAARSASLAIYKRWIVDEYGFIHLDGLPADTELSATRLKLERLFVPLRVLIRERGKPGIDLPAVPIGDLLRSSRQVAILAPPGGGKSTLLKRLATAYASSERRAEVPDDLPANNWLPIILRCRELRDRVHRPILETVDDLPKHAGMSGEQGQAFRSLVHECLRNGEALLLVDGLDEISDEAARRIFANLLRTFVATFPQVTLVVTSREAGFRLVAGTVASVCTLAVMAPLGSEDVLQLSEQWHAEVIGNTENVRSDARWLAHAIWSDLRIRTLAENPLLLTTLFVVKRWIGELPRNRAALYREAIRVLVRTWNIEGYAPLDEGETLARLSYVACAMLQGGTQQIGASALLKLLENARSELEEELQFSRISPSEFVERIEYRSSLLAQTGHAETPAGLEPVYEFRHLTFQEYLAARGYVEEQYPGRGSGKSLNELLEPHFRDETWQEVISLATVLAGRKADAVIKRLIMACNEPRKPTGSAVGSSYRELNRPIRLLYRCIRDEAQLTPGTLREALSMLANSKKASAIGPDYSGAIAGGKFGELFRQIVEHEYMSSDNFDEYLNALRSVVDQKTPADLSTKPAGELASLFDRILSGMEGSDNLSKVTSALQCECIARWFQRRFPHPPNAPTLAFFQHAAQNLVGMLRSDVRQNAVAACCALNAVGLSGVLNGAVSPDYVLAIFQFWVSSVGTPYSSYASRAISAQNLLPRNSFEAADWGTDCDAFLLHVHDSRRDDFLGLAALIIGWYRRAPWTDYEIASHLRKNVMRIGPRRRERALEVLQSLGDIGREALNELATKQRDSRRIGSFAAKSAG